MRIFRYALLAVLMVGLSGIARATTIQILDPSGSQGSFPAIDVNGPNPFSFYDCGAPTGDGCFGFVNDTKLTITSLTATISSMDMLPAGGVTCLTSTQGTLNAPFTTIDACTSDSTTNTIIFSFSGGVGVAPGNTLYIVEDGIPDGDFAACSPTTAVCPGSATVTVSPEPSSIWLALTGMTSLGYVVRRRFKA